MKSFKIIENKSESKGLSASLVLPKTSKLARKIIFIFFIVIFLVNSGLSFVSAANSQVCPGGLVPCGRTCDNPDTPEDETQPCTFCHFFKLIQNIINYIAFRFAPVIAILAVILGGALWMLGGASERLVKWGKDILVGTVWGLVIVYSAWIIINEILLFFVNPEVFPLPWYQIQCPI